MSFLLGSLIAGGLAGLLGTGLSHIERKTDRDFAAAEAEKQRDFNAQQAQIQRDYETQMSNTAVQRQVADMEAAGINSAMAYSNGASGASTPSGASATGSMASTSSPHSNSLASILNSASNLVNSHTMQLQQDRYSHHLDYKEKDKLDSSTRQIFDGAGKLLRTFVTDRITS